LSPDQQDQIAQIILDELADEQRWDEAFANSQDMLARLAAKVRCYSSRQGCL
jgi:aspartate/glutamate racemase